MEIFSEVGAKMGPKWTQDVPSWQQVAPKMDHDSAKRCMLGSDWELLGGPGSDLWKNGRSVKTINILSLLVVFWGLGLPLGGPGGYV